MDFDINAYLRLNPMDMIMVCVSTLIIIAIAKHFFWDKVLAYLDARKAAIQADIDAGMQSREAGEQYKRQYEEQMANARGEAHEILESAKANAVQEKREILAAARGEAEAVKEKARKDIEREKVQARAGSMQSWMWHLKPQNRLLIKNWMKVHISSTWMILSSMQVMSHGRHSSKKLQ